MAVLHKLMIFSLALSALNLVSAIDTVPSLNLTQYVGRWYQMYSDLIVEETFERNAYCGIADYKLRADGKVNVVNANRDGKPNGPIKNITGYAYVPDEKNPGKLKVDLAGVPFEGNYWVVKLGPAVGSPSPLYEYSVVTDSTQTLLFVLARDIETFNAKYDTMITTWLKNNGFDHFYNSPRPTYQGKDCVPIPSDLSKFHSLF